MVDERLVSARYALYGHAHHDLWWARSQQWNVTNWAILLMTATAGFARSAIQTGALPTADVRLYAFLVAALGLVGGVSLWSLHKEVLHNRRVYRALEKDLEVDRVRTQLPQAAGEGTDCIRGLWHLRLMIVVLAGAGFFAFRLVGISERFALGYALLVGLADYALVISASWICLARPLTIPSLP